MQHRVCVDTVQQALNCACTKFGPKCVAILLMFITLLEPLHCSESWCPGRRIQAVAADAAAVAAAAAAWVASARACAMLTSEGDRRICALDCTTHIM